MTTEKRYLGRIKTANTTPPSLTIIPEDPTTRPGYDIALGLSKKQLSEFLFAFGDGEMRVSYVLRPGRTGVLEVQDVQSVFADVKVEEVERARSGSADGPGEVRSRRGKNVSIDRARSRLGSDGSSR